MHTVADALIQYDGLRVKLIISNYIMSITAGWWCVAKVTP